MDQPGKPIQAGTGEAEILEFLIADQSFGLNVLKIQAIEQVEETRVTRLPRTHPALIGTFQFRGSCLPLFDLRRALEPDLPASETPLEQRLALVTECGGRLTAVVVDGVNRIHRVASGGISELHTLLRTSENCFTGSLGIEDREILVLDLDRVAQGVLQRRPSAEPVPA